MENHRNGDGGGDERMGGGGRVDNTLLLQFATFYEGKLNCHGSHLLMVYYSYYIGTYMAQGILGINITHVLEFSKASLA